MTVYRDDGDFSVSNIGDLLKDAEQYNRATQQKITIENRASAFGFGVLNSAIMPFYDFKFEKDINDAVREGAITYADGESLRAYLKGWYNSGAILGLGAMFTGLFGKGIFTTAQAIKEMHALTGALRTEFAATELTGRELVEAMSQKITSELVKMPHLASTSLATSSAAQKNFQAALVEIGMKKAGIATAELAAVLMKETIKKSRWLALRDFWALIKEITDPRKAATFMKYKTKAAPGEFYSLLRHPLNEGARKALMERDLAVMNWGKPLAQFLESNPSFAGVNAGWSTAYYADMYTLGSDLTDRLFREKQELSDHTMSSILLNLATCHFPTTGEIIVANSSISFWHKLFFTGTVMYGGSLLAADAATRATSGVSVVSTQRVQNDMSWAMVLAAPRSAFLTWFSKKSWDVSSSPPKGFLKWLARVPGMGRKTVWLDAQGNWTGMGHQINIANQLVGSLWHMKRVHDQEKTEFVTAEGQFFPTPDEGYISIPVTKTEEVKIPVHDIKLAASMIPVWVAPPSDLLH